MSTRRGDQRPLNEKDTIEPAPLPQLGHTPLVDSKEHGEVPTLQDELDVTDREQGPSRRFIPRKYQFIAFSMIIFFNTSSSFSESTLSPLKSVIRKELGVTSEPTAQIEACAHARRSVWSHLFS